ncbi:MAG: hypothetical protein ACKOWQ_01735 [Aquirufa sp.]
MKKLILMALATTISLISCEKDSKNLPNNAVGYILSSSDNIELSKKSMTAMEIGDSATYRSTYSEDAVFYDNLDTTTLDQNMQMFTNFKAKGITMKLEKLYDINEMVYDKPGYFGASNYVSAYGLYSLTRGDKKIYTVIHSIDGIKDGKQVVEWLRYDTKDIIEILK